MPTISTTPGGILYREKLSVWMRLFIAIIGFGCGVMIPVVWIGLADWRAFSWETALAALVSVLTGAFGLLCVVIALAGVKTLQFDRTRRVMTQTVRGPLGRRALEIPFDRIERVDLVMRDSEDEPYPVLLLFVAGQRHPIELADVGDRPTAEGWREEIEELIAR